MTPRRRPGCLSGCLTSVVLIAVVGLVFVVAIDAVFAPWSFYLGGRFHWLPGWEGIGTLHADTGDYVLYVWMSPSPGGRSSFNFPYLRGSAALCTPRGERFTLRLSASMHAPARTDTDGMAIDINMYTRGWNYSWKTEDRPRLDLRGRWRNPDLVMDDRGSLSRAFLPDGTLYRGPKRSQPAARQVVPIVLREAPWSAWLRDCRVAAPSAAPSSARLTPRARLK